MAQPKKRPFVSLKGLETGRVTSAGKPVYKYKGEEISEKSIDIEADGKTYVIPTVIDGKLYTEEAAVKKFFNKEVEPIKVLKENIKERSKKLAKGGTAMKKQMELFEDGGLKDEGGMVDEVSGNDVPPGSTREEVRDDIPAQLSEGEFVFPADVVRYIGLEKLMRLRQEAKQGLKMMEEMGQMGNSEEATMPDDLPFDETDLDIEDDLEYNTGGVVQAQRGAYVPTPGQIPEIYAPGTYRGLTGLTATSGVDATGPQTQSVRYYNEKLKQVRMIPLFINPDGTLGSTIYPVPEGFVPTPEAATEAAEKTKTPTARVEAVQTSDGDDDDVTGALGGARTTIGGTEYAVSYGLDGSVSLQSVDNYKATGRVNFQPATASVSKAIKDQTLGQLTQLGKAVGLKSVALAEAAKKIGMDIPRYDKLDTIVKKAEAATRTLRGTKSKDIFDIDKALEGTTFTEPASAKVEDLSRTQIQDLQEAITTGRGTDRFTEQEAAAIAAKAEKDRIAEQKRQEKAEQFRFAMEGADERRRARQRIAENKAAQEKAEAEGRVTGREAGMSMGDDGGGDGGFDSAPSGMGGMGDVGYSTAKGGFIPKLKKKTKKMKQGGLASKK